MSLLIDDILVELLALLPRRHTALVLQLLNKRSKRFYWLYTHTFHRVNNLTVRREGTWEQRCGEEIFLINYTQPSEGMCGSTVQLPAYLRFQSLFIEGGVTLHQESTTHFLTNNKLAFECCALEVGRIVNDLLCRLDLLFDKVLGTCSQISLCATSDEPDNYRALFGNDMKNASFFVERENVLRCNFLSITAFNIPFWNHILQWLKFGAIHNLPRRLNYNVFPMGGVVGILDQLKTWCLEKNIELDFEMKIALAELKFSFTVVWKKEEGASNALYCPHRCLKNYFRSQKDLDYNFKDVFQDMCPIHRESAEQKT